MNGERLKIAREAAWLTQKGLADMSGVSAGTISKIEHGLMLNTADKLIEPLADAIGVPVDYFSDDLLPDYPDGRFRKQSRLSSSARKAIASQAAMASGVVHDADMRYRMLKVTFQPKETIDEIDSEEVAQELRSAIGTGEHQPIGNVIRSCEMAGIPVVRVSLGRRGEGEMDPQDRKFSGFSMWPGMAVNHEWRPIIVISSEQDGAVQRSSVAHELAHIYLHTRNPLIPEKTGEEQAWAVAGRLLFPKDEADVIFANSFATLDTLKRIKAKYGISIKFLITYAKRFGYITPERATSLYKQHTGRGWNKKEPVTVHREEPALFPSVIRRLMTDGYDVNLPRAMRDIVLGSPSKRRDNSREEADIISFGKAQLG